MQNRVSQAVAQLPTEAQQNGVQVRKRATNLMMGVSLYSPNNTHTPLFVGNYASTGTRGAVAPAGRRAGADVWRARPQHAHLAASGPHERPERHYRRRGAELREQNVQGAAGRVGTPPVFNGQQQTLTINGLGRLPCRRLCRYHHPRGRDGPAGASEGRRNHRARLAKLPARRAAERVRLRLSRHLPTPSANALRVADAVRAELERLSTRFPDDRFTR